MKRWKTILRERYKVIRDLGIDGIDGVSETMHNNRKTMGHYGYTEGILEYHKHFFKDNERVMKQLNKITPLDLI